jgi:hypothetical protein
MRWRLYAEEALAGEGADLWLLGVDGRRYPI